jgi:hypothetical protein
MTVCVVQWCERRELNRRSGLDFRVCGSAGAHKKDDGSTYDACAKCTDDEKSPLATGVEEFYD